MNGFQPNRRDDVEDKSRIEKNKIILKNAFRCIEDDLTEDYCGTIQIKININTGGITEVFKTRTDRITGIKK